MTEFKIHFLFKKDLKLNMYPFKGTRLKKKINKMNTYLPRATTNE